MTEALDLRGYATLDLSQDGLIDATSALLCASLPWQNSADATESNGAAFCAARAALGTAESHLEAMGALATSRSN